MKVSDLAKELGMTGKELVERAKALGIDLKSHTAAIDERQARMLRAIFPPPSAQDKARAAAQKAKAAKPKAAPRKKPAKKKGAEEESQQPAPPAQVQEAVPVEGRTPGEVPVPAVETAPTSGPVEAEKKEPVAEAVPRQVAQPPAKKKGEKPKKQKPAPPAAPIIQFQFVGEADAPAAAPAAPAEEPPPPPAPVIEEIPKTRIEALLADRRWEKLGIVPRVKSARAQAESRFGGRMHHARSRRRAGARAGEAARPKQTTEQPRGEVEITLPITVRKLSETLGQSASSIMAKLLTHGVPAGINDILTVESAQLLAMEYDVDLKVRRARDLEEELADLVAKPSESAMLLPRPPVVTFMGHVDHGKTSLLDRIRSTNVAAGEAGGITQRIGAYTVKRGDKSITFIDTPGHKAFTEMRARGAHVTDIVVLVVAADDGVMPQTEEALSHARAAKVPIIVALNKIDLPNANPMRARQQLAGLGLNPEEWGGTTGVIECSAATGQGIDALLERILLEAELLELRADPSRPAQGYVLESKVTEGRGIVATVLVRDGTLKMGDIILSSHGYGRARGLFDYTGKPIEQAGPSVPVEVTGLSELPDAGDRFYVLDSLEAAREIAEQRSRASREARRIAPRHVTLETLSERFGEGTRVELRIVLKADLKGVLDALVPQLEALTTKEAAVSIIHQGVGAISTNDVLLADASDAICVGFDVGVDLAARALAEERSVEIKLHRVIYELIDEVKKSLEGKLAPERREVITGHAEVRQTFRVSRAGAIAGCFVLDGTIERQNRARVLRGGTIVFDGQIGGLRHFKEDVREVQKGLECGIKIEGFDDVRVGDQIETYRIEEVARKLA